MLGTASKSAIVYARGIQGGQTARRLPRNSARTAEPRPEIGRIAFCAALLGLALANSLLFFFKALPSFESLDGYSMLVCYVSGSAHLVYVVLPWYLWRTLWPAPARPRGRGRGARPAPGASLPEGSILGFSAAFGGILCLLAIGLWAAQNDLPGAIFASVGLGDLAAVSGPADRAFAGGDVV